MSPVLYHIGFYMVNQFYHAAFFSSIFYICCLPLWVSVTTNRFSSFSFHYFISSPINLYFNIFISLLIFLVVLFYYPYSLVHHPFFNVSIIYFIDSMLLSWCFISIKFLKLHFIYDLVPNKWCQILKSFISTLVCELAFM